MYKIIRYISFFVLLTAYSCSNEFLGENLTDITTPSGETQIYISPSWQEQSYQFSCPGMGDADFEIVKKPDWLQITTLSGKLKNNFATISCKAKENPDYSKYGIYIDKMEVTAGGKTFWIPVSYITEGDPQIQIVDRLEISATGYNYPALSISNVGPGILLWDIVSMPEWLEIDTQRLNTNNNAILPSNGYFELPLKIKPNSPISSNMADVIVLTTNDKNNAEVSIVVTLNLGNPTFSYYSNANVLDFGRTESTKNLSFSNQGNGLLIWSLENLPEWLSASKTSGMLYSYSSENISFVCNRALLPAGQTNVDITLKTNDSKNPSKTITVSARTGNNSANVKAVEGQITDAFYDKTADILYYSTTKPDKLIAYNTKSKSIAHEVSLGKAPTCFSISEDGKNALVGHGGMISKVDLQNFTILKTYNVTGILSDIEFAANNWCAYTEGGNYNIQSTKIYWLDLSTGNINNGSTVYEDCEIKKVPGKDYIIGSETELSSGLYVYDINTRTEKADIFESIDFFWFVNDAENFVSQTGNVYRVSDALSITNYNSNGLSPIGKLQYSSSSSSYGIEFVDYSKSTKSIFCLVKSDYSTSIFPQVYQLDDNNYALMKSYSYDDYYRVNNIDYQVQAKYAFANVAGDELTVIRNATSTNTWSFEFIAVTK